ncbi:hypothetical protein JB92DRAFT_3149294 [Gautieria morchelliformis]|nr:hypothetical protein JB92DRAFT_3149294 [Gautieria morchelliformis]
MFDSLWNFIHNLFLSIMADNPGPAIPLTFYPGLQLIPSRFYDMVCDVDITERLVFVVTELRWYKQRILTSEHEYLVARLQRRGGSRAMFAKIERGPSRSANQLQISSTSSPSVLGKEVCAYDLITCLSQDGINSYTVGDRLLETYRFPEVPLLEFFRVVRLVSQYRDEYELNNTMCYWFVGVIVEVARRLFVPHHPGNSYNPPRGAGQYMFINLMTPQWTTDCNDIEQNYRREKLVKPDPVGPQEEQARERERNAREQGLQEGAARERAAAEGRERALIAEVRSLQAHIRRGGATV